MPAVNVKVENVKRMLRECWMLFAPKQLRIEPEEFWPVGAERCRTLGRTKSGPYPWPPFCSATRTFWFSPSFSIFPTNPVRSSASRLFSLLFRLASSLLFSLLFEFLRKAHRVCHHLKCHFGNWHHDASAGDHSWTDSRNFRSLLVHRSAEQTEHGVELHLCLRNLSSNSSNVSDSPNVSNSVTSLEVPSLEVPSLEVWPKLLKSFMIIASLSSIARYWPPAYYHRLWSLAYYHRLLPAYYQLAASLPLTIADRLLSRFYSHPSAAKCNSISSLMSRVKGNVSPGNDCGDLKLKDVNKLSTVYLPCLPFCLRCC